jgi:hypothetical protein
VLMQRKGAFDVNGFSPRSLVERSCHRTIARAGSVGIDGISRNARSAELHVEAAAPRMDRPPRVRMNAS